MGDLVYFVNFDKKEFFCTIDKMLELELNPTHFHWLLPMMQYDWNHHVIGLHTIFQIEIWEKKYGKFTDVSDIAKQRYEEMLKETNPTVATKGD